ncbi:hypothetical protein ACGF12_18165 [Kitasatospora sp. NPDC048296]|uniref:hypothetical protein n=1 Tax=Kitasatospora sp. NPDC048296 TaxID=3364048 RepID=UPI003715A0E3
MDLETMPRRGRRAVALAAVALAAVVTVAGCNGDGKSSADSAGASASASSSASVSGAPQAPTPPGTPPATASGATGEPARTPPTGGAPTPAQPAPGQPSGAATPPGNAIAPGEPNPVGTGAGPAVRPPIAYRADGGNKLTVYFFGGVCTKYALKADESQAGKVAVEVVPGPPAVQPGQVCTALAKRQAVAADLRSPLAGRTVVDRTSGQEVPLEGDPHAGPDPVTPDGAAR